MKLIEASAFPARQCHMLVRFPSILLALAALTLPAFAEGPLLILIGSPAAGKSTQTEILRKELNLAVISADDLIARNKEKFERYRNPIINGVEPRLDPALNSLVEQALKDTDLTKGVVIDGYPASTSQGEFLVGLRDKLKLPKALVIYLQLPDDEIRKRLTQQNASDIDQQLKDYHREFDFVKMYFPQTDLRTIDATQSSDAIAAEIRKLVSEQGAAKK